jgi:hypothetical protein
MISDLALMRWKPPLSLQLPGSKKMAKLTLVLSYGSPAILGFINPIASFPSNEGFDFIFQVFLSNHLIEYLSIFSIAFIITRRDQKDLDHGSIGDNFLATSETCRLSGNIAKYDLEIATFRFFDNFTS